MINNNIFYYWLLPFGWGRYRMNCTVLRHRAALQLLGMEWPFRVVAPCPAPQKPHTSRRPNTGFRIKIYPSGFNMAMAITSKPLSSGQPWACLIYSLEKEKDKNIMFWIADCPSAPGPLCEGDLRGINIIATENQYWTATGKVSES